MKCPFVIKVCTKCKRILVANEINFAKDRRNKSGLCSKCKVCDKKYREEHKEKIKEYKEQYYQDNKEDILEKNKQYYEEHKDEILENNKQYREKHKNEIRKTRKRFYQQNKEKISEYNKEYFEKNPEKIFNASSKRRFKLENQGNGISKEQWYEMMNFFDWKCAYSGEYIGGRINDNRTIDHIFPLSLNGENEIWNCVPMLKSYNSSKYTKNMIDWYMEQEFFDIDRLLKIYEWIEYAYNKWK